MGSGGVVFVGCCIEIIVILDFSRSSRSKLNNSLDFVKIISLKNSNFDLALRKRLFCSAKQPLLPCKTYAFGMQNNRFCKALIYSLLCDSCACEKYLHSYRLFLPIYKKDRSIEWGMLRSFYCWAPMLFLLFDWCVSACMWGTPFGCACAFT